MNTSFPVHSSGSVCNHSYGALLCRIGPNGAAPIATAALLRFLLSGPKLPGTSLLLGWGILHQ